MKKNLMLFLLISLILVGCETTDNSRSSSSTTESSSTEPSTSTTPSVSVSEEPSINYDPANQRIDAIYHSDYDDIANGITRNNLVDCEYWFNNEKLGSYEDIAASGNDNHFLFYSNENTRVVNLGHGYAYTIPSREFKEDYSRAAIRESYTSEKTILHMTYETVWSGYRNANGWNAYLNEWLLRTIKEQSFMTANNLAYTEVPVINDSFLSKYTLYLYNIVINDNENIARPYYNIAIIKPNSTYNYFYTFVMKSSENRDGFFATMISSLKDNLPTIGTNKNHKDKYVVKTPEYWNDETKAYYNKFSTQERTDWGFFSASMNDMNYLQNKETITVEQSRLQEAMDYTFEIIPTYTHIKWYNSWHYFPTALANDFGGGNGFNGKPVLQFTYQFTASNNTDLTGYTPTFDILRGTYDRHFARLARDIKNYEKPVLFRLNNEMDCDWTSYSGVVNLMDPDLYIYTWQYLYNIFLENGVDNCIWIFNPNGTTVPYESSWGHKLNFAPGDDYMQLMGLTSYEMNNGTSTTSFYQRYKDSYEQHLPFFGDYPTIISEFACGAGGETSGELGRNQVSQAQWVEEMFECFARRNQEGYEFVDNIKGAVWFNVNDYSGEAITNYLKLDEQSTLTLEAFRIGLASLAQ